MRGMAWYDGGCKRTRKAKTKVLEGSQGQKRLGSQTLHYRVMGIGITTCVR